MSKKVYLSDNYGSISSGVEILARGVGSTLGPSGKTVIIHRQGEDPFITKDGVTVANEIDSDDDLERLGILLARKASSKMDEDDGDGTTSATVMLHGFFKGFLGYREVVGDGFSMFTFQNRIHELVEYVEGELDKISVYPDLGRLYKIALTSSNNDVLIADLLTQAFKKVGHDGYINLVDSVTGHSYLDSIDGFVLEMGYADRKYSNDLVSGFFKADIAGVLLYDGEMKSRSEVLKFMAHESRKGRPILVIAKDYSREVMELVSFSNSQPMNPKICLVKNIYRNDEYDGLLSDIEHYTGAVRTSEYDEFDTEVGEVNNLVVKQGYMIFGKASDYLQKDLDDYLELLTLSAKEESSVFLKDQILKRVSRIKNGVTTLYIGGNSEIEIKERRHRVEDAFKACKSAIRNHVVIGGGNSIVSIAKKYVDHTDESRLFFDAILSPFFLILENSMHTIEESYAIYNKIGDGKYYDAKTRQYTNYDDCYVMDPVSVVVNGIKNAVSIFLTVISTECIIIEKNRDYEL